jgi:ribosome maturation factor RimP
VFNELSTTVSPVLDAMGYELVDVEFGAGGLLRVVIDLADGSRPVKVEDCERVSHQLNRLLTVENVAYDRLEVSSPGLDRPLRRASDFERFSGSRVTVRLREPIEGRRQFTGLLEGRSGNNWVLLWSDEPEPRLRPRRPGERPVRPAARGAGRRGARAGVGPAAAGTTGSGGATADGPSAHRLEFALEQVEKARLVPQLAF